MLRAALFPLMMLVGAPEARADITELQLSLRPEFVLVNRHGNLNHGLGLGARAAYGLSDLVAAEASVGCNRLGSIRQNGVEIDRRTGSVFYDATRCTVGPSAALRFGAVEESLSQIRAELVLMFWIRTEPVLMGRAACVPREAARKSRRDGADGP